MEVHMSSTNIYWQWTHILPLNSCPKPQNPILWPSSCKVIFKNQEISARVIWSAKFQNHFKCSQSRTKYWVSRMLKSCCLQTDPKNIEKLNPIFVASSGLISKTFESSSRPIWKVIGKKQINQHPWNLKPTSWCPKLLILVVWNQGSKIVMCYSSTRVIFNTMDMATRVIWE